jgi:hypothetical protein
MDMPKKPCMDGQPIPAFFGRKKNPAVSGGISHPVYGRRRYPSRSP